MSSFTPDFLVEIGDVFVVTHHGENIYYHFRGLDALGMSMEFGVGSKDIVATLTTLTTPQFMHAYNKGVLKEVPCEGDFREVVPEVQD